MHWTGHVATRRFTQGQVRGSNIRRWVWRRAGALATVGLLTTQALVVPGAAALSGHNSTLSGITVVGEAIPDFVAERTSYTFGLANDVVTANVVATPTVETATVACSTDDDTVASGCQVALTAGAGTELTLTVTNGMSETDYTVTLNRGLTGEFEWKASDDIYGLPAAILGKEQGRGIWSDGTTLWAANASAGHARHKSKVYAFNLASKTRDVSNDIDVWTANRVYRIWIPVGVTGLVNELVNDPAEVLVASRAKMPKPGVPVRVPAVQGYLQNAEGAWSSRESRDSNITEAESDGETIAGVWAEEYTDWRAHDQTTNSDRYETEGPTLWAAFDKGANSVVHPYFRMTDDNPLYLIHGSSISLDPSNADPTGIWSDGETMWVADGSKRIFAYDRVSHERVTAKEFTPTHLTAAGNDVSPWGIWSDGHTMWVMNGNEHIYSFNMPESDNTDLRWLEVEHPAADELVVTDELDVTQRQHAVILPDETTATTLTMATRNHLAGVDITPEDANMDLGGHQVDLTGGPVVVTITVTAVDGTTGTYTVSLGRPPPEITDVTLTSNTGQMHVSWQQPADSATLGLTSYDLRYARTDASRLDNDDGWTLVEDVWTAVGGGQLSHVLTELTNDQEYYVQVHAVNALGNGPWLPYGRIDESATGTPAVSQSLDAFLSSISVNDVPIADFVRDSAAYTLVYGNSVTTATVIGTAADSAAPVACSVDIDLAADGCQVSLDAGDSTVVRLTVRSGSSFGNYTVTIRRGLDGPFQWLGTKDLYNVDSFVVGKPYLRGLWSDGTTLWVLNNGDPKGLLAFDLATRARDAQNDILGSNLASDARSPLGLAGLDGVIFVTDSNAANNNSLPKVFAYAKNSNGQYRHDSSRDLHGDNGFGDFGIGGRGLRGIWTDGEVLWATTESSISEGIGAYHLVGPQKGERLPAEDFDTSGTVKGLWSDGETMWAVNGGAIVAYDMVTKQRVADKSFTSTHLQVPGHGVNPWGIWSDGSTMWVVSVKHIFSFIMPVSNNATLRQFRVDDVSNADFDPDESTQAIGLPNGTMTVNIDPVPRHFRATYNITSTDDVTGTDGHQVDVSSGAKTFTATVTAQDTTTTKTYNISLGRVPALIDDATVTPGEASLTVGWTAPSDGGSSDVTSYDLRYASTAASDLDDESSWTEVTGVWQTGGNALSHVVSRLDPRLEYYVQVRAVNSVGPGTWIPHSRISESPSGTPQPLTTLSAESSLSVLSVSPSTLLPAFDDEVTSYSAPVRVGVRQVTVTAIAADSDAEVSYYRVFTSSTRELTDEDENAAGFQVDVGSNNRTIRVRVVAGNLVDTTDYSIKITRIEADTDADLSGLTLNDSDLDALLGFATAKTSYTFVVPLDVSQITVTPTTSSDYAEYVFLDGANAALADADDAAAGFQVNLVGGTPNIFRIVVTAESGDTETYTLRITRTQPLVGVKAVPAADQMGFEIPYIEGDSLTFTITLDELQTADVTVSYTLTGGDDLEVATTGTATIVTGQESVDVTVSTTDNTDFEINHHEVTLTLTAPADGAYGFVSGGQAAVVDVRDNEFTFEGDRVYVELEVDSGPVEEESTAIVTVRVWLQSQDHPPHGSSPPVRLQTLDGTAAEGDDYEALDAIEVSIPPENFSKNTHPSIGVDTYFVSATVEIPILWDPDAEDTEQFEVQLLNDAGFIAIGLLTKTITIAASAAASPEAALGSLSASPATLVPVFASDVTEYTASVPYTDEVATLAVETLSGTNAYKLERLDSNGVEIVDADDNTNGLQVALEYGENEFTFRVTAQDRSTTRDYTLTITRRRSDVATLSALAIRDSASTPTFTKSFPTGCTMCAYSVEVAEDVEQLTVTPTLTDPDATVTYHSGDTELSDADTSTADTFEVDLIEGGNEIEVRVTAADGVATKSYTMTVDRLSSKPDVAVRAPSGAHGEGEALEFTVTLSRAVEAELIVRVSADETGDMITAGPQIVTFDVGATSAVVVVRTASDTDWEAHSDITLQILESNNDDYTVSGTASSATTTVSDDDFPLSDVVLAFTDDAVDEGELFTVTVTVTTQGDEQPHADSAFIVLSTRDGAGAGGAVSPGDYNAVDGQSDNWKDSDFTRVDIDDDPDEEDFRWRTAYEVKIRTVDDTNPETAETFDVLATVDSASDHADKLSVSGSPATATIRTSDFAEVRITSSKSGDGEGAVITYTITRAPPPASEPVDVNLTVAEDGDMLVASDRTRRTVTIAANESTVTFGLATQNDATWEANSTVTVTIVDGVGYTYSEASREATHAIADDDFPVATATLEVSETQRDEADTLTVTLTVTTAANQVPHRGTGLLRVAAASGTAFSGNDFTALDEQVEFDISDFVEVDVDDTVIGVDLRQRATMTWQILITDDTALEPAETFTVSLESVSGGSNPTAANLDVEPDDPAELTVTIVPSDLPTVSITTDSIAVIEGAPITYTVTRSMATSEPLVVNIVVTETSTLVADVQKGDRVVTIGAGQPSTTFEVATSADTAWDAHGTVTAAVADGEGYAHSDTMRFARRNVTDNDFPDASLSLLGFSDQVEEGHNEEIEYVFVTDADEQPHKSTGEFTISIAGGTATVGQPGAGVDVTSFAPAVFSVDPGDFTPFDFDDGPDVDMRWRATAGTTRDLVVADDNDEEGAEGFSITLASVPAADSTNPGDPNITVTNPGVIEIVASDQSDESEDTTLSGLALSTQNTNPPLQPTFADNVTDYTSRVPFADSQITVTPTATDANAAISYREGTTGSYTAVTGGSFEVNLVEGPNVIEILVAAEDRRYTQTYMITINREPRVSIAVVTTASVTEGGDVVVRVTRSQVTATELVVNLAVIDVGDVMDSSGEGAQTVTIEADQASADYTVTTRDNRGFAARSAVMVAVAAGDGYTPHTTGASVSKDIADDDFPGAEVTLSVDKTTAAEGESFVATVTVQTDRGVVPHSGVSAGLLVLRASSSASSTPGTDYSFTERELRFNRSDFTASDIDPGVGEDIRYTARKTETITITDDTDEEGREDLTLLLVRPPAEQQPDTLHPNIRLVTSTATVAIPANDSTDATLNALTLTDGTANVGHLAPRFSPGVTIYTAGVGHATSSVTLSAAASHDAASVRIAGGPRTVMSSSRSLSLRPGENEFTVEVRAENDQASQTYTVTVTRASEVTTLTPPGPPTRQPPTRPPSPTTSSSTACGTRR